MTETTTKINSAIQDFSMMQKNAENATILLKSLANESRLLILCQLAHQEKSVTQLLDIIHLSQSALSQHLGVLRREKIVKTRRDAQTIYYSLESSKAKAIITTLYDIFCAN